MKFDSLSVSLHDNVGLRLASTIRPLGEQQMSLDNLINAIIHNG